jgi:hypothetical protein
MSLNPILLIGGSGVVGAQSARLLRAAHPELPLLIGGRDGARAQKVAAEIGHAEGVVLDLAATDLGLGQRPVSAVAIFFKDDHLAALQFAQSRGVPYLSISSGIHEIAPEVAAYTHRPQTSAIVMGAEWLVGATTVPTLELAKEFHQLHDITLGALIDEQENSGPATEEDFERLKNIPLALARREGAYYWRDGDEAKGRFHAVDGTPMQADAFSAFDVVALGAATGAPNIRFNLANGVSSSRRRGEPMSTEIIIELTGQDHQGQPLRTRHGVVHPQGQMYLTGLGVTLILQRLLGLDGQSPTPAGLYFPYQLLETATYFEGLKRVGGEIVKLEVL